MANRISRIFTGLIQELRGEGVAQAMQVGSCDMEECDVSAGDATPTMNNCRCVYSNGAGRIKIDFYNEATGATQTEIIDVDSSWRPARNITKVYRYTTGSTEATSTIRLAADDTSVIGLKLRR